MKKIILSAVAVLAFGFTNAQDIKFGAKAALNVATLTGEDAEGASSLVGFQVGGFVEIPLAEKFAFQPELMYSAQGAKFDGGEVKLGYLNIPLMVKYYVAPKFNVEFGPQVGFLLSAKSDFDESVSDAFEEAFGELEGMEGFEEFEDLAGETTSAEFKDSLNKVDFGLSLGAGYDFTENFSAGVRYNLGLSNIYKSETDANAKNSVLSLSVGYKF